MGPFTRAYGEGALFPISLLDAEGSPAGLVLETGMTFAAADLVLRSDEIAATLTAESIAFTSGSTKPSVGDTLTGATSTETLVVIGVVLTSGTWSGADAAGTMFVEQVSGVFQSENLNNTTESATNVMTIGGDVGGVAAAVVNKGVWVALTSTEMACQYGNVEIVDATATEVWLEATVAFETYGNASALHPVAEVNLADDAITSAKYDESSAFPQAAALSATAIGNLEDAYDGTGYDLGGIDVSELNGIVDDLLNGGRLDLLIDAIKVVTDRFGTALIGGTTSGTPTETTASFTGLSHTVTTNELRGRTVIFADGTGGSQAGRITANTASAITYTTLTTAPATSLAFVII